MVIVNADSAAPGDAGPHRDPVEVITGRRSHPKLVPPGPTAGELDLMLAAAASAPDHGRLRPWRFVVLAGGDRGRAGQAVAETYREDCRNLGEPLDEGRFEREQRRFCRAPVVVLSICRPALGRMPEREQLAAVAAATQNILLTATALGYGSMWRTGWIAEHPGARAALGLSESEHLVAFVYLGTSDPEARIPPRNPESPPVQHGIPGPGHRRRR
jgi:nitroreductase